MFVCPKLYSFHCDIYCIFHTEFQYIVQPSDELELELVVSGQNVSVLGGAGPHKHIVLLQDLLFAQETVAIHVNFRNQVFRLGVGVIEILEHPPCMIVKPIISSLSPLV